MNLGFVGLGLMGGAFTERMLECGHSVYGFDRAPEKLTLATEKGVITTKNAAEIAAQCDQIHVCVMTVADLTDVLFGDQGISSVRAGGKILIDHSTTPLEATKDLATRLKSTNGMDWIDAPISGGPPAAREGTLAIMAGGETTIVERAMPVLSQLGHCTRMGNIGTGQVAKMVNQVLVLNNYCILAEALALAEAGGVDASLLPDALAQGYAGSNMLQKLYPRMVDRDFKPAGYAFQILKDLDMVHDLAKNLHVPTPMSGQASSLFRLLSSKGHGELDGTSILKLYDSNEDL